MNYQAKAFSLAPFPPYQYQLKNDIVKLKSFVLLFGIMSVSLLQYAQPSYEIELWRVLDIPFKVPADIAEPLSVEFGATFTHESGQIIRIPGYYDDNSTWILRFSPEIEGNWEYTTYGSLSQLSGQTGSIIVSPNADKNQHGPIQISPTNPQRFIYADGTPYFLTAFELDWLFALDWDNEADIPKTRAIIDQVAANGFNQIVMNVYAYDAGWGDRRSIKAEHNFAKPTVFPFGGTNEEPDYTTLNIAFFQHLDRVLAQLNQQQIVSHLMIYVWNKQVNWPEPYSKADNMYFDYVVKRYQAFPNLIWDISKEALAYGRDDMGYISERIDRLKQLDGHKRLVSVHDYAYCSAFPGKVDFISIQTWKPHLYSTMRDVVDKYPDKPIFNIEHGGYEQTMHRIFGGAYSDPIVCLERNYQCIFAGSYSTYYWQNTSWYEVAYNPQSLPEDQQPHFAWYKNMVDFFTTHSFDTLVVAPNLSDAYCLTDHQNQYLFYLAPNAEVLSGDVKQFIGKTVSINWFHPLSGEYFDGGQKSFKNGSWLGIRPPEDLRSAPFLVAILTII